MRHKGVLIFAFNNSTLNYFKQAVWVADRVERFLGLSTTIVTNKESASRTHHNVVLAEAEEMSTSFSAGGHRA